MFHQSSRRMARLLAVLALLVSGTVAAVLPAAPAQAQTGLVICIELRDPSGRLIEVVCFPLAVRKPPPPWEDCIRCGVDIEVDLSTVLPKDDLAWIAGGLAGGLRDLVAASVTGDQQLRAAGLAAYASAAAHLGQSAVSIQDFHLRGDPNPEPNDVAFRAYGKETVLGLNLARTGQAQGADGAFLRGAAAFSAGLEG